MSKTTKKRLVKYTIETLICAGLAAFGYIYAIRQMFLPEPFGVGISRMPGADLVEIFFWFEMILFVSFIFIHGAFTCGKAAIAQLDHQELTIIDILQMTNDTPNKITVRASDGLVYNLTGFYAKERRRVAWARNVLTWKMYPVTINYAGTYQKELFEMLPKEARHVLTRALRS